MTHTPSLDTEEIVMAPFFLSELYDSNEGENDDDPSGFLFLPVIYPAPPATYLSMN